MGKKRVGLLVLGITSLHGTVMWTVLLNWKSNIYKLRIKGKETSIFLQMHTYRKLHEINLNFDGMSNLKIQELNSSRLVDPGFPLENELVYFQIAENLLFLMGNFVKTNQAS